MRIRKMKSVDVQLHDSTKVKLKTAGNTQVVQFTTGYIIKETIVSQWFEEMYALLLDTIFSGIDIDDYDFIKQAWKKFYDAHHVFCNHDDRDGDGQYDNCLWSYMTAASTYEYRYDENWQLTKCIEKLQNGSITEYDYQYDKDGTLLSEQTGLVSWRDRKDYTITE